MDPKLRKLQVDASLAEWTNETDITKEHEDATAKAGEHASVGITKMVKEARSSIRSWTSSIRIRSVSCCCSSSGPAVARRCEASRGARADRHRDDVDLRQGRVHETGDKESCKDVECGSKQLQHEREPGEAAEDLADAGTTPSVTPSATLFVKYVELANEGAQGDRLRGRRRAVAAGLRHAGRTRSRPTPSGCGPRSSRSTTQLHCYARAQAERKVRRQGRPKTGPSRRTCSATCGRRSGRTSIPSSSRTRASRRSTSRRRSAKKLRREEDGEDRRGASSPRSASTRCRRRSGSARCFKKPPRARTSSVTPARGTSTFNDDLRIKMCIKPNAGGSRHDPPRARPRLLLPRLLQAPDPVSGRRERRLPRGDRRHDRAVDDAGVPEETGLLDKVATNDKATINQQMQDGARQGRVPAVRHARRQVALGRVLRQGRRPTQYNEHWWELRTQVPGRRRRRSRAARPTSIRARSSTSPANTPYMRYFLAAHPPVPVPPRALQEGRLHRAAPRVLDLRQQGRPARRSRRCSRSARASRGRTRSTQLTGEREMDAGAILEYFAPLQEWLEEQNKGQTCGW